MKPFFILLIVIGASLLSNAIAAQRLLPTSRPNSNFLCPRPRMQLMNPYFGC